MGKDSIWEAGNVYELVDLRFGYCRFAVAVPQETLSSAGIFHWQPGFRLATKFPAVAAEYMRKKGWEGEIIKLHGNIELAPRVGLAEAIVDIVSTGKTLRENGLVPLEFIGGEATARLIVNRASYRLKAEEIKQMVQQINAVLEEGGTILLPIYKWPSPQAEKRLKQNVVFQPELENKVAQILEGVKKKMEIRPF